MCVCLKKEINLWNEDTIRVWEERGGVVNFFSQFLLYKFLCVCAVRYEVFFAHFNGDEVYNL